ncbi:MAG: hypothetical protein Q8N53_18740 [Longimicrobiales bacterium]|nr:hypothetical protein [Longimicrobiales bacterium]
MERPPVQKWGILVTHLSAIRDIPVAMSADQLTRVVRLFYVSRFLLRTGRWMGWVKAAADRLEVLTLLVARQEVRGAATRPAPLRP